MAHPALNSLLAFFRPAPGEVQPPVRFIPAVHLFVHAEPVPEGMLPAEVSGFAEVTMESLAPLPIEQLAWGYLVGEGSLHLLVFAAARERLEQENLAADESFFQVLPSFFAAAPADKAAHWVMLWEAGHVAALRYEANQTVPSRVELELVAEDTPAGAFAARERLLKRLGPTAREAQAGLLAQPASERGQGERLRFYFLQYDSAEAEPKRVEGRAPGGGATVWSADLRDSLFREAEQKRRRGRRVATRVLQAAGAVAVVLFVLQLVWVGGTVYLSRANEKHASRLKAVKDVQDTETLLNKIAQFTEKQLRPFEIIGTVGALRPKGVLFRNAKLADYTVLTVDARAPDASAMSNFIDNLRQSNIGDITPGRPVSNLQGVNFPLTVKLHNMPEREPMPPEKPPEPPPPPPTPATPPPEEQPEVVAAGAGIEPRGGPRGRGGPVALPQPVQPAEEGDNEAEAEAPAPPPPEQQGPAVYL